MGALLQRIMIPVWDSVMQIHAWSALTKQETRTGLPPGSGALIGMASLASG